MAAATPSQLTAVLDLDLWRHAHPGGDEQFDVGRFGEWLEVLVDKDEHLAARTVAAIDQNVVIAGLSRYVRVFDPGIFEPTAQSDDERVDRHDAMREGDDIHAIRAGRDPAPQMANVQLADTCFAREERTHGTQSSRCWSRSKSTMPRSSTP